MGHTGMLGQMAVKYFGKKGYRVITFSTRFEPSTRMDFMNEIRSFPDAIIINAIGKIKQKTNNEAELLWANAILPLELKNRLLPSQTLVHPSTDCVFSGNKGEPYTIDDEPDATDSYGWSKRLGELALLGRPNTVIIRVSMIGPDRSPAQKGLLGWFLSQPEGSELKGFTNHLWNGITTLEWCKQVESLLELKSQNLSSDLVQIGTLESYSKFEMLTLFRELYFQKCSIIPFKTESGIDLRLKPTLISKDLHKQLNDLIAYGYDKG